MDEPMDEPPREPVKYIDTEVRLPYHYVAGDYRARYLRALKDKKILGSKCAEDRQGVRHADRELAGELRALRRVGRGGRPRHRDHLLHRQHPGDRTQPRDSRTSPPRWRSTAPTSRSSRSSRSARREDVRMGMRVEAVWKPDGERQGDHEDILYFRPTGEPDAPIESYHPPAMSTLRNVALVGFAQLPVVARDEHRMSTEMLYPVVREALAQVGVERDAIDYQVSASADYIDGRPVRLRRRARRHGVVAGDAGPAPRDGRLLRRLLRVGEDPDRRGRHRHRVRPRQDVGGRARARAEPAARPVLPGSRSASGPPPRRRCRRAPIRPGPAPPTPTSRPSRHATARPAPAIPTTRFAPRPAPRTCSRRRGSSSRCVAATCRRWARAPRAWCWPPRGRPRSSATSRCGSTASTIAAELQSLGARDLSRSAGAALAAREGLRDGGAAERARRRPGRAARHHAGRGADPVRGARASIRTPRSP